MALDHTPVKTTGFTKVSIAPVGVLSDETVWTEAFVTLRDSVNITQAVATKNPIYIDQADGAYYQTYTPGDFTVTMDVPDTASSLIDLLFETTTADPFAPSGQSATGIKLKHKPVRKMMRFEFESGSTVIITNADITSNFSGATLSTTMLSIHIEATAMAGSDTGEDAEVVIYQPTGVAPTFYTWVKYASDANGTGMSDTKGSLTYTGVAFNKSTAVESDDPLQYTWFLG